MSSCSWDAPPSPQERRSVDARPTSASTEGEQEILFRGVQQKPSFGGDPGESDLCCFSPTPKTPTSGLLLLPDGPRTLTTLIVSWLLKSHGHLHDLLTAGIIRVSASPAGAPFFFVTMEDKTLRPCID